MSKNIKDLSAQIRKQDDILKKLKEQSELVSNLITLAVEAKKIDVALVEHLEKAKARLDWLDTCKEYGIDPNISYINFKQNVCP